MHLYYNDHLRRPEMTKQSLPALKSYTKQRVPNRSITEAESDPEYNDYKKRWDNLKTDYSAKKGIKNASTSFDKNKIINNLDIMTPKEMISLRTPIIEGRFDLPAGESQRKFFSGKLAPLKPTRESSVSQISNSDYSSNKMEGIPAKERVCT